jgi:hypothetical protein
MYLTLAQFGWTQSFPQIKLEKVPAIGDPIPAPSNVGKIQCMVNSAQFDPCVTELVDGIMYTVAMRQRNGGAYFVTRVSTIDPKFKSIDGIRVGDVITVNGPEDIFEAPYFEVYARSKTQWVPIVGNLGRVNVVVGDKGGAMKDKQSLWPNGPTPVRLWIGGFVEQETKASSDSSQDRKNRLYYELDAKDNYSTIGSGNTPSSPAAIRSVCSRSTLKN